MTKVTVVEVRTPLHNPAPHSALVESDLVFLGSSRSSATAFIAEHPNHCSLHDEWCWFVYEVELDDPKSIPHDKTVIGSDGRTYRSQRAAWDACLARASDRPGPG